MVYTLRFFPPKCSLFHNSNEFGSCIIHILYTGCAKIKKIIHAASLLNKSAFCYKTETDPTVSSGYGRNVIPNLRKWFSFEIMVMEDDPC